MVLERLEYQLALLRADLDQAARFMAEEPAIIGELAALASSANPGALA